MTRSRASTVIASGMLVALAGAAFLPQTNFTSARAQGQAVPSPVPAEVQVSAAEALRRGQYAHALAAARAETMAAPQNPLALKTLLRALLDTGAYVEADEAVRAFMSRNPKSLQAWVPAGDVAVLRGRRTEAETAYGKAIALKTTDALSAEASLGILLHERGQLAEARVRFERLVAAYNGGRAKTARDLIAVGRACQYLGISNPSTFKDALKAFDEAAALDDTHEAATRSGELFLEKFNGTDARSAFEGVLKVNPHHPEALLGLARAFDLDGERGVPDLLDKALKTNPNFALARAYRSGLLLALEDSKAAKAEAEQALAVNPMSREALSALAAAQYVTGDQAGFAQTRASADALFPKSAEVLVAVAEAAVKSRLYLQAENLAQEAVTRDPESWSGFAALGQNQLRLGKIEAARKNLDRSFAGDPYNVWVKNTLDLLDTFANYATVESGRFRLFLDKKEAGILQAPMESLAREAIEKLSVRYGFDPQGSIRIEAFPSHADFSVRTVGLAGLGALGVCFGPVVAIDSPQARDRGSFNWGSTLWHELAHVVTLGASANRVPRWLTEGISVYEERRARPGWGDDLSLEFLMAYKASELLPLKDLNNGFVRPARPEQVGLSYYQASLVVEFIEARHGISALRGMLGSYAKGMSTADAFQASIGKSVEAFDVEFQADLRSRLETPLAGIFATSASPKSEKAEPSTRATLEARLAKNDQDFLAHATLGRLLHREKREDEALRHLIRAAQIWPASGGDESPYFPMAEIKRSRGDVDGAVAALRALIAINESHDAARLELAALLEGKGQAQEALTVTEGRLFIYPFDPRVHERLAALGAQTLQPLVVRDARRALVELDPVDKAEAHYQLALAEMETGDRAAARRSVLRSLEIAPRFERAQELLLQLHREPARKEEQP